MEYVFATTTLISFEACKLNNRILIRGYIKGPSVLDSVFS